MDMAATNWVKLTRWQFYGARYSRYKIDGVTNDMTLTVGEMVSARLLEVAQSEQVAERPPKRLVEGRHILDLFPEPPGPWVGHLVRGAYAAQLDGLINTLEEGLEWLRARGPGFVMEPAE